MAIWTRMRTKVMERFKSKQLQAIVATDVAARGIDVNDITHVINYELPDDPEVYTHRSPYGARRQVGYLYVYCFAKTDFQYPPDTSAILAWC